MIVHCPTCNRAVEWAENSPWRPFCSERCKLIDLGAWACGQRAIPGNAADAAEPAQALPEDDLTAVPDQPSGTAKES